MVSIDCSRRSPSSVSLLLVTTLFCLPLAFSLRADAQDSELARALTFHASFDGGAAADFGRGDRQIYTAESYKSLEGARAGLHVPHVRLADGRGRYGAALEFTAKNTTAIYYRALNNVRYQESDWSGTVSFWLSLDPDADLAPGYCDPIQVTDANYNDGAWWVDFSKDERPRHFRLGIFGDLEAWNPEKLNPDQNPAFQKRLITNTSPPFGRGKWTHVVFTVSHLNNSQPGSARLYLDGQPFGAPTSITERFTWDASRATIRLGLNYTGLFDDLAVFGRDLTEPEVATLHKLEKGVASLYR